MPVVTASIAVTDIIDGTDGTNGSSAGTITIYRRGTVAPSTPADTTDFDVTDLSFTVPTGWFSTVPSGTNTLYNVSAAFVTATTTLEWSVVNQVEGTDGTNGTPGSNGTNGDIFKTIYLFQNGTSTPTVPADTEGFNASTGVAVATGSWTVTASVPSAGQTIYVASATLIQTAGTGNWSVDTSWAAGAAGVSGTNGTNGTPGTPGSNGSDAPRFAEATLYTDPAVASAPAAPSATITWSTGALSAITSGWSQTPPTILTTSSDAVYSSQLVFIDTTPPFTTTTATGGTPVEGFNFSGLVTFSGGDFALDGTTITTIDGGNITTNSITAEQINGIEIAEQEIVGNTGVGTLALDENVSGTSNTAFGYKAGTNISTASRNTLLGTDAGGDIRTGDDNTFVGFDAGANNNTGENNVAVGRDSSSLLTTGSDNVTVGYFAGQGNAIGSNNVIIGARALNDSANPSRTTALGYRAAYNDNAVIENTAVSAITFSTRDTAGGLTEDTWDLRDTSDDTVAFSTWDDWINQGLRLDPVTAGIGNYPQLEFLASRVQLTVTSGSAVAVFNVTTVTAPSATDFRFDLSSFSNLVDPVGTPGTTGSISVAFSAFNSLPPNGSHTDCTFLGAQSATTTPTDTGLDNVTTVGFNAVTTIPDIVGTPNDNIILGNGAIDDVWSHGTFTTISDRRDKTDIEDLTLGLDFVKKVNAKSYYRNSRGKYYEDVTRMQDGEVMLNRYGDPIIDYSLNTEAYESESKRSSERTFGFIAQDIQEALGDDSYEFLKVSENQLWLQYVPLIPVLWKSVQELSEQNEAIMARLDALEGNNT